MANMSYADSFSDISDEEFYTATQLLESSLQTSTNVADLSFPDEDLTTAETIALTPTLQNPRADDDDFPDSELSQADMNSLEHLLNLPGTSTKKCDADATVCTPDKNTTSRFRQPLSTIIEDFENIRATRIRKRRSAIRRGL